MTQADTKRDFPVGILLLRDCGERTTLSLATFPSQSAFHNQLSPTKIPLKFFLLFFKKPLTKEEKECIIVNVVGQTAKQNARVAELADAHV